MKQAGFTEKTRSWIDGVFETCAGYREARTGDVTDEESSFVGESFKDLYWLAKSAVAAYFHLDKRIFPSWVFADQPDPRTEVETLKYLLALGHSCLNYTEEFFGDIVRLLGPSAVDPTGSTSILEAMLSYAETQRSPTYADTLVGEADLIRSFWDAYDFGLLEAVGISIEGFVFHPSDSETMAFGCYIKRGRFVRVAVGDPEPLPLDEVVGKQLALASSYDLGHPTRFHRWLSAIGAMNPSIAHRRVFMPLFGGVIEDLTGSCHSESILGVDSDWIDLLDGVTPAFDELDKALRAGLTEQQVSETVDQWDAALRQSRRKIREIALRTSGT